MPGQPMPTGLAVAAPPGMARLTLRLTTASAMLAPPGLLADVRQSTSAGMPVAAAAAAPPQVLRLVDTPALTLAPLLELTCSSLGTIALTGGSVENGGWVRVATACGDWVREATVSA